MPARAGGPPRGGRGGLALAALAALALPGPPARAQQQCSSCLDMTGACSTTPCQSGITASDDKLYLGGLFGGDAIDGGAENAAHFQLAVDLINDKTDGWYDCPGRACLLPTTTIVAQTANSACSALPVCDPAPCKPEGDPDYVAPVSAGAPGALWDLLQWAKTNHGHNLDAVVGPACSGASNAAAYFAEEFRVPLVSYSATSKTLTGRSPYFFRLSVPDSEKSLRVVDLLTHFGWTYAAQVSTDTNYGKDMSQSFRTDWLAANQANKQTFARNIDVKAPDAELESVTLEVMASLDGGGDVSAATA